MKVLHKRLTFLVLVSLPPSFCGGCPVSVYVIATLTALCFCLLVDAVYWMLCPVLQFASPCHSECEGP